MISQQVSMVLPTTISTTQFTAIVYDYYAKNKRDFAWRRDIDAYRVVVSEVMLQQTQTHRVEKKFDSFITAFPSFEALARAPLREVLAQWQGLGYNRRALALQKIAQKVVEEYGGVLPDDPGVLVTFPGIGPATAASICAFAGNKPTLFIETNIRAVFIHFFFQGRDKVTDKEIFPLVEKTVDTKNPREWYYALMDYGVMLKKKMPNPSRRSAHHIQQSKFEGSERQIRGMIVKMLTQHSPLSYGQLVQLVDKEPQRVKKNLSALCAEGLVKKQGDVFTC
jgi:A/G-specific adenine glycosylase